MTLGCVLILIKFLANKPSCPLGGVWAGPQFIPDWIRLCVCLWLGGGWTDRSAPFISSPFLFFRFCSFSLRLFFRHLPRWSLTSCPDQPMITIKRVIGDNKQSGLTRILCNSSGLGHHNKAAVPVQVGGDLEGVRVQQVSTYGDCSLAVSTDGHVFGWGNSEYLQLASVTEAAQVRSKQTSSRVERLFRSF